MEQHTQALQEVRRQLAPWEQQLSQVQSRLGVATAEQAMLHKSHADAQQRLQVCQVVVMFLRELLFTYAKTANWLHNLVRKSECRLKCVMK